MPQPNHISSGVSRCLSLRSWRLCEIYVFRPIIGLSFHAALESLEVFFDFFRKGAKVAKKTCRADHLLYIRVIFQENRRGARRFCTLAVQIGKAVILAHRCPSVARK
jgi:hypothetical protein